MSAVPSEALRLNRREEGSHEAISEILVVLFFVVNSFHKSPLSGPGPNCGPMLIQILNLAVGCLLIGYGTIRLVKIYKNKT
jgi:hypothetical protein